MPTSTRRRGVIAAAAAAGVAASLVAAPSALARPIENSHFVDEYGFVETDFCGAGLTIEFTVRDEGHILFNSRKPGTAPYWQLNLSSHRVASNAEGDFVTEIVRTVDRDHKITVNDDGTLTILVLATGNSTLYDESGKAIARNPGQVRYEAFIDYGDDLADPSDDEFLGVGDIVKGSTGRSDDYCEVALPILG